MLMVNHERGCEDLLRVGARIFRLFIYGDVKRFGTIIRTMILPKTGKGKRETCRAVLCACYMTRFISGCISPTFNFDQNILVYTTNVTAT